MVQNLPWYPNCAASCKCRVHNLKLNTFATNFSTAFRKRPECSKRPLVFTVSDLENKFLFSFFNDELNSKFRTACPSSSHRWIKVAWRSCVHLFCMLCMLITQPILFCSITINIIRHAVKPRYSATLTYRPSKCVNRNSL